MIRKLITTLLLLAPGSAAFGLTLVHNGQPQCVIVMAEKPTLAAQAALTQLQLRVTQISGAQLPVAKAGEVPEGVVIYLGDSPALAARGVTVVDLAHDDWIIRSEPEFLALAGRDVDVGKNLSNCVAGTWNAVIAFLEEHCGARFLMPGDLGTILPQSRTVAVPDDLDIRGHKNILWGAPIYTGTLAKEMGLLWRGAPGLRVKLSENSWAEALPVDQFHEEHPDYYALVGDRRDDYMAASLCLSNPAVIRALTEWAKRELKENDAIELSQPRGYGYWVTACQCDKCAAMGDLGERVMRAHLAVAEAIRVWDPSKRVLIAALGPTQNARAGWKFPDNVIVDLAELDSLTTAKDGTIPWRQAHNQFMAQTYYWLGFCREGFAPHCSLKQIGDDFALFRETGTHMIRYFSQPLNWGMEGPQYYLDYRLRMDAAADPAAVMTEYCAALYGPAAARMKDYFDVIEEAQATPVPTEKNAGALYLTRWPRERTDRALALLNEAVVLAAGDRFLQPRVELSRPATEYIALTSEVFRHDRQYRQTGDIKEMETLAAAVEKREKAVDALLDLQKKGVYRAIGLPDPFYTWDARFPLRDQLLYGVSTGLTGPFRVNYAALVPFARAHGIVKAPVSRVQAAPKVDGDLGDAAWKEGTAAGFFDNTTGAAAQPGTALRVAADDAALYLAFACDEPEAERIAALPSFAGGSVKPLREDGVEIWIAPGDMDSRKAVHLIVGISGRRYQERVGFVTDETDRLYYAADENWADPWESAVKVDGGAKRWVVEVAISWTSLGFGPADGPLRANFARHRPTLTRPGVGPQITAWSPAFGYPGEPSRFGALEIPK